MVEIGRWVGGWGEIAGIAHHHNKPKKQCTLWHKLLDELPASTVMPTMPLLLSPSPTMSRPTSECLLVCWFLYHMERTFGAWIFGAVARTGYGRGSP